MERLGGGFIKGLAALYRHADEDNRRRLREAFPEYWDKYAEMARLSDQNRTGFTKEASRRVGE